jgi:hypothetical protein
MVLIQRLTVAEAFTGGGGNGLRTAGSAAVARIAKMKIERKGRTTFSVWQI